MDLATTQAADLPAAIGLPRAFYLAWSPDGSLLAMSGHQRVSVVDASATGGPGRSPIANELEFRPVWTGPRTLLVADRSGIDEANVDTGQGRPMADFNTWPGDYFQMGEMQIAPNLAIGLQSRPASTWPDRGPWPTGLRISVNALGILLVVVVVLLIRRRRVRLRRRT
jgi:hypothetical protein